MNRKKNLIYISIFVLIIISILSIILINESFQNSTYHKKSLIKSNFNLIDQNSKIVTNEDFYGKFTLIFFGFTFCPDVCPNTLNKISIAYDLLQEDIKKSLKVIFITVDPERDNFRIMNKYVSAFNKEFIGLTGSEKRIKQAADSMGVYFKKNVINDTTNEYLIDHSSIKFLMDKKGSYLAHFSRDLSAEELSKRISEKIKNYE
ncbi:MAG: SCO family protein [Rhodospirillaceae bacterium]|nr:SCO family protein [Rhodospirillaceae bacterium]|tara:strand:- start:362 stop:973 length:612 start_codon:yes stop_codon:yes gene_type:complete